MQHLSPRRPLPSGKKIVSLLFSFLSAVAAFGLGIGVVYATVTISENIQLGSGTPDLTLDGDDLYVTGTFEVDGATQLDGSVTLPSRSVAKSELADVAKPKTGATQVVCASDAKDTTRCDRVADGTDDDVEIQAAIDALPSAGGKVVLSEGQFNTNAWISIDRNDVHIQGAGARATLIRPADGADVGGFHIAVDSSTQRQRISISDLGYDGNKDNQDQSVKQLHGVIVDNAKFVRIERTYWTKTSPYQEHNTGGSGISVETSAREVTIADNWIEDIGDRGIQFGGKGGLITRNVMRVAISVMESPLLALHPGIPDRWSLRTT